MRGKLLILCKRRLVDHLSRKAMSGNKVSDRDGGNIRRVGLTVNWGGLKLKASESTGPKGELEDSLEVSTLVGLPGAGRGWDFL